MTTGRACLIAATASIALLGLVPNGAVATTKPGISIAKASATLELKLRIVDPEIVAMAQDYVRTMKQQGGTEGIKQAKQDLALSKQGFTVDRASCLGTKTAAGGYTAFRCRLLLSSDLFFTGRETGTYKRLSSGGWRWYPSAYTRYGPGPAEWLPVVRG